MGRVIEVPFAGGAIHFAVSGDGGPQAFGAEEVIERAADRLEDAIAIIRRIGENFAEQLSALKFQTAEASFGVTLTGKGKFVVAEASAQGSLTVKLVFKGPG